MAEWVVPGFVAGGIGAGLYFLKSFMNGGVCTSQARLDGKVVIITGANTGLGKVTAIELAGRGAKVILACRDIEKAKATDTEIRKELNGNCNLVIKKLDLASLKSIRQFADEVNREEEKIHILINNAGVMFCKYGLTEDGFETHFGVNHLGHFLLTNLLIDKLKKSAPSRIITITSIAHEYGKIEFDNLNGEKKYSKYNAYSHSKLANVYFSKELSKQLAGTGVTSNTVHPGAVRTELPRHMTWLKNRIINAVSFPFSWLLTKNPWQGAQTSIYCAVDEQLEAVSGKYFSDCKEKPVGNSAMNDDISKRLWDISMEMTGLQE